MKDFIQWGFVVAAAVMFAIGGWFAANFAINWYKSLGGISLNKDILGIRIAFVIIPFTTGFLIGIKILDRFNKRV